MRKPGCRRWHLLVAISLLSAWLGPPRRPALAGSDYDEFKVKREAVFEFAEKPTVTRDGDRVTIAFASKGFCDATVAVEDAEGRIVRHLASGVLGPNAPAPFQRNSKEQTLVWDGKDDQGRYIDDPGGLTVRVSLGLKPWFEKSLFYHPKKRIGKRAPLICAAPEGVYVYDGRGVDFLRLFDHDGNYVRTIYPFPASRLKDVKGLKWRTYPWGDTWPIKYNHQEATLLTSGASAAHRAGREGNPEAGKLTGMHAAVCDDGNKHGGTAVRAMAAIQGRLALVNVYLNRLTPDSGSGELPFTGPMTCLNLRDYVEGRYTHVAWSPESIALSPDGKTLYLTCFAWYSYSGGAHHGEAVHAVLKVSYETDGPLEVFAGSLKKGDHGTDNTHFRMPTSVACDGHGRVYVSDFGNHRVQVFSPDGRYVKSLMVKWPAKVMIHQKSQDIWVSSHPITGMPHDVRKTPGFDDEAYRQLAYGKGGQSITRFGPFESPGDPVTTPVNAVVADRAFAEAGHALQVELDSWARRPTLWLVARKGDVTEEQVRTWGMRQIEGQAAETWAHDGIVIVQKDGGQWTIKRDFSQEVKSAIVSTRPWSDGIERLRVNPATGRLYILEQLPIMKSNHVLIEIDPDSSNVRVATLPLNIEDFCFDLDGYVYVRTDTEIIRYNVATWREIPWDYGEPRKNISFYGQPRTSVIAALPTPGKRPMWWHLDGMDVSPRGHLAVMCPNGVPEKATIEDASRAWKGTVGDAARPYQPPVYPGRLRYGEIHVWDMHGALLYPDAIPGLKILDGTAIDRDDNLYVLMHAVRVISGKPYWNNNAGTLMKFRPGKGKIVTSGSLQVPVPLAETDRPDGVQELEGFWVDGAEWFFGGAGHTKRAGGGCNCWHSRFTLDYFARSFVPETERYSVAALDTNGNLIMRIGAYGNVDDEGIGLIYPSYVATDTDRRLFIADLGNARIVSVRLDYYNTEHVALKDVPDHASR